MRKIILTGAVLAMLTSAAPMVHAQIDPDVQTALDNKVNKQEYTAKIQELEGKANGLDGKIDNVGKSFNQYKDQNEENLKKKLDADKLQDELTKQKVEINNDVQGKIDQAKNDLKGDINQAKTELESKITENKKLIQGDDGNGGLKGDIKKLQDAVGDNNSGLQKEVNTIKATAEAQRNVLTELNKVVGKDENEGLRKAVKENANNITQADNKAESAKAESAAASRLALEVKGKAETADQKATQALTDVAELKAKGNDMAKDIAELGGRIDVTGAMSAALAGLKPLQYDPMAPTQVMGSVSTYEGQQAYALGLAHFTSEDLMVHGGVSFTNSHKYMANVGVTYKFGHSAEKSMIPMRYQAGPISSIYVMQKENEMMREKMAQQEERIAQLEEMIMNMKK